MSSTVRKNIDSLPGPYSIYGDGNLGRSQSDVSAPRIVLMGSAGQGADYRGQVFNEDTIDQMSAVYGSAGNLLQQSQEMQAKGGNSALAVRIGARPAFAMHIGASSSTPTDQEDGYWIQPLFGGQDLGTRFGVAYNQTASRLIVEDKANGAIIFDNNSTAPRDLGLVLVRGTQGTVGTDIGDALSFPPTTIALNALTAVDAGIVTYNGDDGTQLSRMRLFEGVMKGFYALEGFQYSYVAMPPGATLDAPFDGALATLAPVGTAYPALGSLSATAPDKLGKVFIEEVDDQLEFYWDVDGDGTAEYWSVVDTATTYSETSKGGTVFAATSFTEPNFGYALAYHCQRTTLESHFAQGIIGVELPPIGKPLSAWIGKKPTYSTAFDGSVTVGTNGSGLLGNKYLAGNTGYRNAAAYGGFIETSQPWFDNGVEQLDFNNQPIDMGKFLSVWMAPEIFAPVLNVNNNQNYLAISPAAYAGFRDSLLISESPTNKAYPATPGVLTANLNRSKRADLQEMRYTLLTEDFTGIKVMDGPSAALPFSDYTRQGTIEIVQFVDRVMRQISDPFIGRNITAEEEVALQKELTEGINGLVASKVIRGGSAILSISPDDRILGVATVNVRIDAPFELRRIFFNVNLRRGN